MGDRFELFLQRGKFGFSLVAAFKESLVASFRLGGELVLVRDVVFGRFAFEEFYFYRRSVRFEDVLKLDAGLPGGDLVVVDLQKVA